VAALLRVAAGQWDRTYLDRWIAALDLSTLWREAQTVAGTERRSERE